MKDNILDELTVSELIAKINNGNISCEELEDAVLEAILDYEIEMICHGSGDMNMIQRCSEILNIRSGYDKTKSVDAINKFFEEHVTII